MNEVFTSFSGRFLIAPMRMQDLDSVLSIEQKSFPNPYSRKMFEREIELDLAYPKSVWNDQHLVAFFDYWIVHNEIHLITLAVDPNYRRQGIAEDLMRFLDEEAKRQRAFEISLDVRASNQAAISLYKKAGYELLHIRKRYYGGVEDALVMVKKIRL